MCRYNQYFFEEFYQMNLFAYRIQFTYLFVARRKYDDSWESEAYAVTRDFSNEVLTIWVGFYHQNLYLGDFFFSREADLPHNRVENVYHQNKTKPRHSRLKATYHHEKHGSASEAAIVGIGTPLDDYSTNPDFSFLETMTRAENRCLRKKPT